ncbi:hypothetical protein M011DRAFT_428059 [Sporormia fimetaria CBS 119925]|uniref:Ubiquitin 3 binding protein But2 C-terminal domain-containing protein n=1 Tax=Sporormia fimetaria CBS 119925 TaxID=1340428 RepID=A0A6A6V2W3_9PLEO|nr:hypothetical protein M011DRAFT_428059 [Sporormia fimetaria CBS 119925]
MLTSTLLPLLSLPFTLSLTIPRAPTETWPIPTISVHFMGRDTGLPGNTWPEYAKFNSTLDFTVEFPTGPVACSGNWEYTKVPTTPFMCEQGPGGAAVQFTLAPTEKGLTGAQLTLTGSQEVRANSPGEPNSYLSCLGGAPLDGIRCKNSGWASTAGPLVLEAK